MRHVFVFLLIAGMAFGAPGGAQQASSPGAPEPPAPAPPPVPESERVGATPSAPATAAPIASEDAYLEPAKVQALLHNVWLASFRINDLLTEAHPERWKLDAAAENSFHQSLDALRAQLSALEEWRGQFEKRAESMYLGYETYAAISAALPRLDGVIRAIAQHENASLAAQYQKAENQLYDAQQALEPHLRYLLRNQDQLLLASQSNLASCENQLGYAMRPSVKPATLMPNVLPVWPARHRSQRMTAAHTRAKAGRIVMKKPAAKAATPKKPAATAAPTLRTKASALPPKPKATAPAQPVQNVKKK